MPPCGRDGSADDHVVWDTPRHDFLRADSASPDTTHPGLWRLGCLNAILGLFEVAEGVWQARCYDISNLTFIAGDIRWVLVEVLTTRRRPSSCSTPLGSGSMLNSWTA